MMALSSCCKTFYMNIFLKVVFWYTPTLLLLATMNAEYKKNNERWFWLLITKFNVCLFFGNDALLTSYGRFRASLYYFNTWEEGVCWGVSGDLCDIGCLPAGVTVFICIPDFLKFHVIPLEINIALLFLLHFFFQTLVDLTTTVIIKKIIPY